MTGEDTALKSFLEALAELSISHGFMISGCGCCASPGVDARESDEDLRGGRYETDECGGFLTFKKKDEL